MVNSEIGNGISPVNAVNVQRKLVRSSAAADLVDDGSPSIVVDGPASGPQPPAEVVLSEVEKKLLIIAANNLQRLTPYHQERILCHIYAAGTLPVPLRHRVGTTHTRAAHETTEELTNA